MNRLFGILALMLVVFVMPLASQAVSITVNGSASPSPMTAGDLVSWTITLPPGTQVHSEIWVDVNTNGAADPASDRLVYRFLQEDGTSPHDGPGDTDGMVNGAITFGAALGLAPAQWIFLAYNDASGDTVAFQVLPLASPVATITGSVTGPAEFNKANVVVVAEPENGGGSVLFWQGLTNADGNYTIQLGGNPSESNPWRVTIAELGNYSPFVALVPRVPLSFPVESPVVNFEFVMGTYLTGTVVDQLEDPLAGVNAHTHDPESIEAGDQFYGSTNDAGYYEIIVPPGSYALHFTRDGYFDQWWNGKSGGTPPDVIVVTTEDTVANLNGMLTKGAEIRGFVRNYGAPVQAYVELTPTNFQYTNNRTTGLDGSYSFTVSPGSYYVKFVYQDNTIYYDQSGYPGTAINISGTETVSNVDADFSVGEPPMPDPPMIVNIWDRPFDNGRHVYLKWTGVEHLFDFGMGDGLPLGFESYSIERREGGNWVYMMTVPASGESTYTAIVPTLRDSTLTDGMWWSRFRVKAHFIFNLIVLTSAPDSGYSLDNMAPGVPAGVGSTVAGGDVIVRWNMSNDDDLRYYNVYRTSTSDESVSGLVPYAKIATNEFVDAGAASGSYYYRISATDFAGNESFPSAPVSSSGTSAAEDPDVLPTIYSLGQNYPNPFNPSTRISFDLPEQARVRLAVYNTLGEEVMVLVDGEKAAGRHAVSFDGTGLPSGLYLYRLQSDKLTVVRKMNLLK